MLLTTFVFYTTIIAIFSVSYISLLSHEPVLNWWFKFGLRFENSWVYPIIWGCPLCNSGQIALWFYLYNWIFVDAFSGDLINFILFVGITILQAHFVSFAYGKTVE